MFLLLENPTLLSDVTNLGASGLMGAMWLWERRTSRTREQQLDEAHARVMSGAVQVEQLIAVVKENSQVAARLCVTHDMLLRRLEGDEPPRMYDPPPKYEPPRR